MRKDYVVSAVKYFNQWNNKFEPQGTCNFTSVASVLTGYGILGDGGQYKLPDQLFLKYNHMGRHSPLTMQQILIDYGLKDDYDSFTPWGDVLLHLKAKHPVILHGDFTESGHIILLKQMLPNGMIEANDSNGKFSAHTGLYNKYKSGENDLWNPASLLKWTNYTMLGVKTVWAHLIKGG